MLWTTKHPFQNVYVDRYGKNLGIYKVYLTSLGKHEFATLKKVHKLRTSYKICQGSRGCFVAGRYSQAAAPGKVGIIPSREPSHIPLAERWNIIDSKVPAGRGYVIVPLEVFFIRTAIYVDFI